MVFHIPLDSRGSAVFAPVNGDLAARVPTESYAPMRAFATLGQERLMGEFIATLRASLSRLHPRARPVVADRHRRLVARSAGSPNL